MRPACPALRAALNNRSLLSDNMRPDGLPILNNRLPGAKLSVMKQLLIISALFLGMTLAGQASAQCFADYKAKQDNPLRLQYGIVELPRDACGSHEAATEYARPVIAQSGWTLLQIESLFDETEFQRRSANASAIHRRQ